VVGLDLDHTLAVYDDPLVNALAFDETCRNLLEFRDYPPSVVQCGYDHSTVARGLIADTRHGTLVKLDHRDRVLRARGPKGYLGSDHIQQAYGGAPFPCDACYQVQSPFDLPAGALFASLADVRGQTRQSDMGKLMSDIVCMLDHAHRFGGLKRRIVSEPDTFIQRRPGVEDAIRKLQASGKKTFVLTNSGSDYTVDVLDYLFPRSEGGGGWETMFDAVVVDANKPAFFGSAVGPPGKRLVTDDRAGPPLWSAGSAYALEKVFATTGDRILYIGDNPAADSLAARACGWRTALVVPEIEPESHPAETKAQDTDGWGSIFWEGAQPTRFLRLVRESAHVYAARVEQILMAGPHAVFRHR
jgi:HAD superfamily 5'-nucleotidase-like hydrolase